MRKEQKKKRGGWGVTYQEVYLSDKLTIEAKAIYGMLCSLAGTGDTAYPSVGFMCDKLQISRSRFYKHMNLLVDAGIVKREQEKEDCKFSNTIYTLVPNLQSNVLPYTRNENTENKYTRNEYTRIENTENLTTNNNTINNNTLNNNIINTNKVQSTYAFEKAQPVNESAAAEQTPTESHTKAGTPAKKDIDAFFEQVWSLYPSKKGKGRVSDTQKKKLFKIGLEELTRAVERYKEGLKKDSWRKPQNGSTFFNSGYIDYLDKNYVQQETEKNPNDNTNKPVTDEDREWFEKRKKEHEERLKLIEQGIITEETEGGVIWGG